MDTGREEEEDERCISFLFVQVFTGVYEYTWRREYAG